VSILLEPVDDAAPSGPDLEYDAAFFELEQAAAGKPERQAGGTLVPAQDPEWKSVVELATDLFGRTKDLRVAAHYTNARAAIDGVAGLADGYRLVAGLIERFWDDVHPRLDPDDDNDPTMRLNAVATLTHPDAGVKVLRGAVWLQASGMRVTVRQALAALGAERPLPDGQPAEHEIDAMIRAVAQKDAANHAREALAALRTIGEAIGAHLGQSYVPDLASVRRTLSPLADRFDSVVGVPGAGDAQPLDGQDTGMPDAPGGGGVAVPAGAIRSREDAIRLLDRVCDYLARTEPSNPAPLLIRRAQRLMTMDFLDIMRDLAPEALAAVQHIAGASQNDEQPE